MSEFKWRQFEGEIILWAVRWYCRYGISYRDLEQMMGEGGVPVDHSTIYRWVQRFAPEIEKRLRWQWRHPQSTSWEVDETTLLHQRFETQFGWTLITTVVRLSNECLLRYYWPPVQAGPIRIYFDCTGEVTPAY